MSRPLNDSKRGDNTYILRCDSYGGSRHYAVCIHIMERIEQKRPRSTETSCVKACAEGECVAMKMRREERKAQESLYFMAREDNPSFVGIPASRSGTDVLSASFQNGWEKGRSAVAASHGKVYKPVLTHIRVDDNETPIRSSIPSKQTVTRRPRLPESVSVKPTLATPKSTGNLYADLVNKLMAEQGGKK